MGGDSGWAETPVVVDDEAREDGVLRLVVTADNHLSAFTPKLSPQRLSERRERLRIAFSRVVDEAIARRAHLVLQAGDLFDSTDPRNLERAFVATQLMRLRAAGIQTFGIGGNHDTPRQRTEHGGYAPQGVYAHLGGLRYFTESRRIEPVLVEAGGLRVAVAGLSFDPGAAPGSDPLDGVMVEDPDGNLARADLGILMLHAAIEGHGFPAEDDSTVRRASIERLTSGFNVVLAGHIHAYARFHVAEKDVVVCGPTERMTFGEAEGKPGFAYLEVSRAGLSHAEHIAIPSQPRHIVTIRTSELWPQQQRVPTLPDSTTMPEADTTDGLTDAASPVLAADADSNPSTISSADAMPAPAADGAAEHTTRMILSRIEPYCTPDTMLRLCLTGPITREQYRALDLRRIWLIAQRQAFSCELDESNLFLMERGSREQVARGERVAPHDMLEQIAHEWIEGAQSPEERALFARTRERVLASYAHLVGREATR